MISELTFGGINLVIIGGILIGLIAGAVLRSAKHINPNAEIPLSWSPIARDLLISSMSGMSNFIIAGVVVAGGTLVLPDFPVLGAAAVGMFVGFKGPDGIQWFSNKYFGEEASNKPDSENPVKPVAAVKEIVATVPLIPDHEPYDPMKDQ
jgi:hypothetical protein